MGGREREARQCVVPCVELMVVTLVQQEQQPAATGDSSSCCCGGAAHLGVDVKQWPVAAHVPEGVAGGVVWFSRQRAGCASSSSGGWGGCWATHAASNWCSGDRGLCCGGGGAVRVVVDCLGRGGQGERGAHACGWLRPGMQNAVPPGACRALAATPRTRKSQHGSWLRRHCRHGRHDGWCALRGRRVGCATVQRATASTDGAASTARRCGGWNCWYDGIYRVGQIRWCVGCVDSIQRRVRERIVLHQQSA